MAPPEELARQNIDALLEKCGWKVQTRFGFFNKNLVMDWSSSDKMLSEGKARG